MRAINTTTLQLQDIDPERHGTRYAILSHTWDSEEVLFDDIRNLGPGDLATTLRKKGANKVIGSCVQAKKDRYHYIWIDTCCIDKSSSAELSEAINSMFKWYALASVCYAYLGDVAARAPVDNMESPEPVTTNLLASKWFSRGWTLQELIAPPSVIFFDREWEQIGTRSTVSTPIARETSIHESLLNRPPWRPWENLRSLRHKLETIAASTRMTWAHDRETTRGEDLAYCLMGLFDVNMPLLYGEGEEKAFTRLQREIITARSDQSILAWTYSKHDGRAETRILAPTPRVLFIPAANEPFPGPSNLGNISLQGHVVQATVFLAKLKHLPESQPDNFVAVLQFQGSGWRSFLSRPALPLQRLAVASGDTVYRKVANSILLVGMGHRGGMTIVDVGRHQQRGGSGRCIFIWA